MEHWQPYFIAIVIGLLVGIEREKAHPTQKTMGVRTFLLLSLLGAVAGDIQNIWLSTLVAAFAFGLILISYFSQTRSHSPKADQGLTTEFAAGIIFCLGFTAHQSPALSALMGPIVALVLFSKSALHRFTHTLKPSELEAALLLLLAFVVVVNLVPDTYIDPWGIFNPKKFGFLVLILGALEFASYVLTKIIGIRASGLVIGFLGGLVSSTAVLLSSARNSKKLPATWKAQVSSTLSAKLAALIELLVIIILVSPDNLFMKVFLSVAAGLAIGGVALAFSVKNSHAKNMQIELKSPLDWKGVLRLSLVLAAILALISASIKLLGEGATFAVSFLTGLFELHGVTIANATMHSQGQLSTDVASLSIIFAVVASLIAKIAMSWIVDRGPFSRAITGVFVLMIIAIGATTWLTW